MPPAGVGSTYMGHGWPATLTARGEVERLRPCVAAAIGRRREQAAKYAQTLASF